jgi:hypothetical protein
LRVLESSEEESRDRVDIVLQHRRSEGRGEKIVGKMTS